MTARKSVYRCAECGHGEDLTACAYAVVHGPVGADGELAEYGSVEDTGICEDSIQCEKHPGAPVEKFAAGTWCRWWTCPDCQGLGRVRVGVHWKVPDGYQCSGGIEIKSSDGTRKAHQGWRPVAELAVAS